MTPIFLSLGSSIGNAEEIFETVTKAFEKQNIKILKKSKNLKNAAYGGVAKNEFTNAVWEVETELSPEDLLKVLQAVEQSQGRVRDVKWSDRTLDIDILMFDQMILDQENLKIPHPEISKRLFVLQPWRELVDERFEIPTLGRLSELLEHVSDD